LILLFLFGIRCRPAELVDAKKKRKDTSFDNVDLDDNDLEVVDNDNTLVIDKSNNGFGAEDNQEFGSRKDYTFESNIIMSGIREDIRQFDAICYKDIRLLVVRNSKRNILAIEVTIAYHKKYQRRPKP
jgi:hypothetical protein